jgi:hypothetical protein
MAGRSRVDLGLGMGRTGRGAVRRRPLGRDADQKRGHDPIAEDRTAQRNRLGLDLGDGVVRHRPLGRDADQKRGRAPKAGDQTAQRNRLDLDLADGAVRHRRPPGRDADRTVAIQGCCCSCHCRFGGLCRDPGVLHGAYPCAAGADRARAIIIDAIKI